MYKPKEYLIHGTLFLLTLVTTTLAGGEWVYGKSILASGDSALTWSYFLKSLHFSIPFIGILLVHELGHLFTSIYHKVRSTLPYFIPAWLGFLGSPSLGTFGAIIRMKGRVNSRKKYFDIGIAGPLAGFVVAFGVLTYGMLTLPGPEYLYEIHPEYADPNFKGYGEDALEFELGNNLLFWAMGELLADPNRLPSMSELIHYPFLFAGYLALFFTALNLLPMGQLDGGHVLFGLFPKSHARISLITFTGFMTYAGLGVIRPSLPVDDLLLRIPLYLGFLYFCFSKSSLSTLNRVTLALSIGAFQYLLVFFQPAWEGYSGWLFFGFLLGRVMGINHPEVQGFQAVDRNRKVLGWIAILVFILCFSPQPFQIS